MRHKFLLIALLAALPMKAHALSCMEPKLDQETYDRSAIIFEGTVLNKTPNAGDAREATKNYLYTFKIDRVWKGEGLTDMVAVERDTYWGDDFLPDVPYLVVAQQQDGKYISPLCGNSMPAQYATQQLEFLNNHKTETGE